MASETSPYRVEAWDWDEFCAEMEKCPASQQERVSELLAQVLPANPKATRPPLLKKLKGQFSHMWQLECGDRRLIYTVDDERHAVRIEYFGMHPKW